jgi:hypothetical protein
MTHWRRVKSASEWGLFFGICSWLAATAISNKIPTIGVWGIILSRTLMGFIIGYIKWEFPWWGRGLIIGGGLNVVLSFVFKLPLSGAFQNIGWGWIHGVWLMVISGMIFGVGIELAVRHREAHLKAEQEKA